MAFKFKIPLQQETAIAFQDSFDTKDPVREARAWIYKLLTNQGVKWSDTEGHGGFNVRTLDKQGRPKNKDTALKELNMKDWAAQEDPEWIPENWDREDLQPFEIMIGNTLIEKLRNLITVQRYVSVKLNESGIKFEENRDIPEAEKEHHDEEIEELKEEFEKYNNYPIEKFLHGILIQPIIDKVKQHEKKSLEKEYDELYPDEKKKKKAKVAEGAGGVRKDPKEKDV